MLWSDIEGWFSDADAAFVQAICRNINGGIVVELGFYAGRCTAAMAPVCKIHENEYHAIDNCKGTNPRDPATKAQLSRNMLQVFKGNMKQVGLLDYVGIHILDSAASAQLFSDGEVDFCFIDASHNAEDVAKDMEAWWPKIKSGGVMGGHDYSWGSVRGETNHFANYRNIKLVTSGSCWKMVKPGEKK